MIEQINLCILHGRFVIIYNGEIFNYLELKSELEKIGVFFNTKSDRSILNGL